MQQVTKIFRAATATNARPTIGVLQAELDATHVSALTPVSMDSATRSFNNYILKHSFCEL